jgi:aromatic ring hydroxylase
MNTSPEELTNRTETQAKPIRSGEQYIESLRGRDLNVFLFGERVEEPVDHPIIRPSINAVARTYDESRVSVCHFAVHG